MTRGRWVALIVLVAAVLFIVRPKQFSQLPRSRDLSQLAELEEILSSRNDNDPRLDRDFIGLSPDAKRLLRAKYRSTPRERLNERGTIVYLLGKNLTEPADWAFILEVASEPPCLSLSDCSKRSGAAGALGDEVTLAYPSLVALRQAARGGSRDEARKVLAAGKASKSRAVARLAASLDVGFDTTSR